MRNDIATKNLGTGLTLANFTRKCYHTRNMRFTSKSTIIFDLDGTLISMKKATIKARFRALRQVYGSEIPNNIPRRKIIKTVGRPFTHTLAECCIPAKLIAKIDEHYSRAKEEFKYLNRLNLKTVKLLIQLHKQGKTIVLATNKKSLETFALLKQFGLEKYFDHVVCKNDGNFQNKAEMIKSLGIDLNNVIIFGNMKNDIVSGAAFVRSFSMYGDIIAETIKTFISYCDDFIRDIFATPLKYKIDGFT